MGSLRDLLNAQRETKSTEKAPQSVSETSSLASPTVHKAAGNLPPKTGLAARLAMVRASANSGNGNRLDGVLARSGNATPMQRNVGLAQPTTATPVAHANAPAISGTIQKPDNATAVSAHAIQRTQVVASADKIDNKIGDDVLAQIQEHIRYLAENINEKELVGQTVRTIAMQLQQNPQVHALITNPEYDIITRGFMSAYNFAARKRVEKQEKRTAKKETSIANREDLDKAFAAIDFSL